MNKSELPFLSAGDLSRLIQSKEVSPVEATEAYLDRIESLDHRFHSYLTIMREQALADAGQAEQDIASGQHRGPMHGVPVAVKDQFWSKGVRSTGGSRILADFVPDEDATVIAKLRKAGAVVLGKTNMTEFAITGFSHRYSTPRNPWDIDTYTGGSSSGSGAATAAYLCATSLGEDTGGSIRFPAAWCGLVGIRPSWGLVSRYGVMQGVWSMDTVGPISRTVEDAAITLGAIAGHDSKDPYSSTEPVPDYRQSLGGDLNGLKIGVITEFMESDLVEPAVRQSVSNAIATLGELGATVEEVSIPLSMDAGVASAVLLAVEPALAQQDWIKDRIQDYGHDVRLLLLTGSLLPAQAYYKAQKLRTLLRQQVLDSLEKYDVLVLPTSGKGAQLREEDPPITSKETAGRLAFLFTRIFNLASCPAMSVPCGFDDRNMPVGLQIGARPRAEETIFKVAHAYEQATSWHTMRPPGA
ncbi:MAG: Asp-tRNA(Asn)/Glu-tRNA(Gln) amidotransferase GatCAB subunit A [Chloroflexi bacterium]|jgi:aspartyl-tRNA(Asn)/glutamyl-tRNA(Gln) amidotransferase subunit A|nr:Asp-tRNA(Asn)/Glu-tRNA(Gln) amidotransferase GatCAB subunit A [Chloroflexota bacterium]MQG55219.1 amidase [SAR202 cluster bacterium]|tara:strand:- start:26187 stop:27593 length:1407 start_codon:yes stop_codon:yes gene_type:complete